MFGVGTISATPRSFVFTFHSSDDGSVVDQVSLPPPTDAPPTPNIRRHTDDRDSAKVVLLTLGLLLVSLLPLGLRPGPGLQGTQQPSAGDNLGRLPPRNGDHGAHARPGGQQENGQQAGRLRGGLRARRGDAGALHTGGRALGSAMGGHACVLTVRSFTTVAYGAWRVLTVHLERFGGD